MVAIIGSPHAANSSELPVSDHLRCRPHASHQPRQHPGNYKSACTLNHGSIRLIHASNTLYPHSQASRSAPCIWALFPWPVRDPYQYFCFSFWHLYHHLHSVPGGKAPDRREYETTPDLSLEGLLHWLWAITFLVDINALFYLKAQLNMIKVGGNTSVR